MTKERERILKMVAEGKITVKEAEELLMRVAVKRAHGNQTLAAMLLGITRQTLHNRLQK